MCDSVLNYFLCDSIKLYSKSKHFIAIQTLSVWSYERCYREKVLQIFRNLIESIDFEWFK